MPSLNISCFQLSLAETDNLDKATNSIDTFFSKNQRTDLIVLSELAITGVNPDRKKSLDKFLPTLKDLAKKYRSDADALYKEVQELRKKADELAPKTTAKKTAKTNA